VKTLKALRAELVAAADPAKAPQMQAYMKSAMPYHGVPSPVMKKLCKGFFKERFPEGVQGWEALILELWDGAKFREERYAALHVAADKRAAEWHTFKAMPLFEHLIVTGAWWDYVDDIASHRVGAVLRVEPKPTKKLLLKWSKDANFWKRRTAILSQLGFKDETDLEFLYACIEPSLGEKEFFLRKGIGWALRQYAWTDPKEVKRYVKEKGERLSPLSRREALKNVT